MLKDIHFLERQNGLRVTDYCFEEHESEPRVASRNSSARIHLELAIVVRCQIYVEAPNRARHD